jgi:ABC-type phosphonate transport system ATPase subunit
MALRRWLISKLDERTDGAVEAESRRWHLVCPECGWSRSYWDLGGVRYKAASKGKRTLARCPQCDRRRWMRTEWIDET